MDRPQVAAARRPRELDAEAAGRLPKGTRLLCIQGCMSPRLRQGDVYRLDRVTEDGFVIVEGAQAAWSPYRFALADDSPVPTATPSREQLRLPCALRPEDGVRVARGTDGLWLFTDELLERRATVKLNDDSARRLRDWLTDYLGEAPQPTALDRVRQRLEQAMDIIKEAT